MTCANCGSRKPFLSEDCGRSGADDHGHKPTLRYVLAWMVIAMGFIVIANLPH
jgi:hypothetical protein